MRTIFSSEQKKKRGSGVRYPFLFILSYIVVFLLSNYPQIIQINFHILSYMIVLVII